MNKISFVLLIVCIFFVVMSKVSAKTVSIDDCENIQPYADFLVSEQESKAIIEFNEACDDLKKFNKIMEKQVALEKIKKTQGE